MSVEFCNGCSREVDTDWDVEGDYDEKIGEYRCARCWVRVDEAIVRYLRQCIDSAIHLARHEHGSRRRNLAHEARGWNRLLVRELRGERTQAAIAMAGSGK